MSLGWAAEAAPAGGMDAVQKLIEQRMQMARDAEVVRSNMAREQQAKDQLTETTGLRRDTQQAAAYNTEGAQADKQADLLPGDSPLGPADQSKWQTHGLGGLLKTRPLDATAPTTPAPVVPSLTGGMSTQGGVTAPVPGGPAVTGMLATLPQPADTPVPGQPGDMLTIPTQKNQIALAEQDRKGVDQDRKGQATEAAISAKVTQLEQAAEHMRMQGDVNSSRALLAEAKAEAARVKAGQLNLSQGGKAALRAIEGSGPLTDQALRMMEQQFPGIDTTPEKYNGVVDKMSSLYHAGKYYTGFADPNDPRQQLVSLLKPIQAGQYTQSSRSYKMVELALEHMGDMTQTPARQYEAMRNLRSLMPELREGVIRAERPVDPNNPLGGSYFDPERQGATTTPPAAAGAHAPMVNGGWNYEWKEGRYQPTTPVQK